MPTWLQFEKRGLIWQKSMFSAFQHKTKTRKTIRNEKKISQFWEFPVY